MNLQHEPGNQNEPNSIDITSTDANLADALRSVLREDIQSITEWNMTSSNYFASDTHCILKFPLSHRIEKGAEMPTGVFARSLALIWDRVPDQTIDPRLRFLKILEHDLVQFAQTGDVGRDRAFYCKIVGFRPFIALAFRWNCAIALNRIPRHDRLNNQLEVSNRAKLPQTVTVKDLGFLDSKIVDFDNAHRALTLTTIWEKIIPTSNRTPMEECVVKNLLRDQVIRLEDMGHALDCIRDRLRPPQDQLMNRLKRTRIR
jgi:hypothetical protein